MRKVLLVIAIVVWSAVQSDAQSVCDGQQAIAVQLKVGGTISYTDTGKGPAVILVHGLGGNSGHWRHNVPGLAAAGMRVISINLPGYAGNALVVKDANHQLSYYASAIDELVMHLGIQKASLVGHSMGGQIGMVLALQRPKWLTSLVLAAPAGIETFTEQEATLMKKFATASFFAGQQSAVIQNNVRVNFVQPPSDMNVLVEEREAIKNCTWFSTYCLATEAGVQGMLGENKLAELPEIHLPVLVLYGDKDALIPNRVMHPNLMLDQVLADAKKALPNAQIKTLPDAGHMLQWEQPAAFNKSLLSFLPQ